jgi:hypothetical protein
MPRLLPVLLVSALAPAALAQTAVPWSTIDGGGGKSASVSGQYILQGTIGQHDAQATSANGRYTLRSGFWVPYTPSAGGGCGTADFNCDGNVGTDADIEAFFTCLAGTCPPPPCTNSADFNGDGNVGTDADIEAFFRVLAGGNC